MRKYRVLLPIEVDGVRFEHGDVVQLEMQTAIDFAHALVAIEESEEEK
jgi:hypothetical protein